MTAINQGYTLHRGFKAAVFALLVCNAGIYLAIGTLSQALDATAWLTLLALFMLETGFAGRLASKVAGAIHAARLAATVAVCAAAAGYFNQRVWLDAVNSGLWIAVVVLLEFEVRYPRAVERYRAWFAATAAALYTGLAALILVWAWHGKWFDAYDALLWLTAFAMIEMDVLQISRRKTAV